jgi:hypothetical protein
MKTTRKATLLAIMGSATVTALALLALWLSSGQADIARAQGPILVALDMDPTGNSCPGDGVNDCTLGTTDRCVQVSPGASFSFDVILDDLPPRADGEGLVGLDFKLVWGGSVSPAEADVIDITLRVAFNSLIHVFRQAAGSAGDLHDPQAMPVLVPPYIGGPADASADEPNPPWTQGTAWRGAATVSASAAPGVYRLQFDPEWVIVGNLLWEDECVDGPGCLRQGGLVAVDKACPRLVGGIAELPQVSDSSGPSRGALAGLAAAALLALTAGAWYSRRRWVR